MIRLSLTLICPADKALLAVMGIVVIVITIWQMAEGRLTIEDVVNHILLYTIVEIIVKLES